MLYINELDTGDEFYTIDRNSVVAASLVHTINLNKGLAGIKVTHSKEIFEQDVHRIFKDPSDAQEILDIELKAINHKFNFTHEIIGLVEPAEASVDGLMIVEANYDETVRFETLSDEDQRRYLIENGQFNVEDISFHSKGDITDTFTMMKE